MHITPESQPALYIDTYRIDLVEAVYQVDVEELSLAAEDAVAKFEPCLSLSSWLDSFLRYYLVKRVFLTGVRETFEKNQELRVRSLDSVKQSFTLLLESAQRAGVAPLDIDGSGLSRLVGGMCTSPTLVKAQGERPLSIALLSLEVSR